jgi:RNA polymerase sigma-70 factor (ECF subfamily)
MGEMRASLEPGFEPTSLEDLVADPVRFRAWYDDAVPRVYRYLMARCGDQSLAEEVTQQAFVEAIRASRQFVGTSDLVTWICAIGRNRLVDHVRRDRRNADRHLRLIDQHAPDASVWQASDERDAVEAALAWLPKDQRLSLTLRYLDQLPVREIAGLLHRSESATESLLSRARDGFRRAYEGHIDE